MKFQLPRYSGTALFFASCIMGYITGFFFIHKKISIDSWFWIHSTIAQSFAALVGLTAIFIIYTLGRIDAEQDNIINKCRVVCTSSVERHNLSHYIDAPQYAITYFGIDDFRSSLKKLKKHEEIKEIKSAEERLDGWALSKMAEHLKTSINEYNKLNKLKEDLKSKYLEPFLLAIIVIIWAIAFLPREQISGEWLSQDNLGWLTAISLATVSTLGLIAGFLKSVFT